MKHDRIKCLTLFCRISFATVSSKNRHVTGRIQCKWSVMNCIEQFVCQQLLENAWKFAAKVECDIILQENLVETVWNAREEVHVRTRRQLQSVDQSEESVGILQQRYLLYRARGKYALYAIVCASLKFQ